MFENLNSELKTKMDKTLEALQHEFAGVRTGRATPSLIESIHVDAYGSSMPLNQLGTITAQDRGTLLVVNPWDKKMLKEIEKAIMNANIGLMPNSDADVVKIPVPPLSEERRRELSKLVSQYAEHSKVSLRNIRRDAMDRIKQAEKEHEISEDELHRFSKDVQKITDDYVAKIDTLAETKTKDLMNF